MGGTDRKRRKRLIKRSLKILTIIAAILTAILLALFLGTNAVSKTDAHKEQTTTPIIEPEPESWPELTPEPEPAPKDQISLKTWPSVDPEKLRAHLEAIGSPLASHAEQIAASEFSGMIIGICTIEQYNCTRAPYYNYWGMMSGGGLKRYNSLKESITDIDRYLNARYESGRSTIESFRGYYCYNGNYPGGICPNWEWIVKQKKTEIENL